MAGWSRRPYSPLLLRPRVTARREFSRRSPRGAAGTIGTSLSDCRASVERTSAQPPPPCRMIKADAVRNASATLSCSTRFERVSEKLREASRELTKYSRPPVALTVRRGPWRLTSVSHRAVSSSESLRARYAWMPSSTRTRTRYSVLPPLILRVSSARIICRRSSDSAGLMVSRCRPVEKVGIRIARSETLSRASSISIAVTTPQSRAPSSAPMRFWRGCSVVPFMAHAASKTTGPSPRKIRYLTGR